MIPKNNVKVCDVGGGDGSRYKDLFNSLEYISVDLDSTLNPTITASAESIPLPSNYFDVVLSVQLLEHTTDPTLCLKEMFRITKPGGICIITVPFFNEAHMEPNDFYRFTKFGIEYLVQKVGFQILESHSRGKYYSVKAQMSIRKAIEKYNLYNNYKLMVLFRPWSRLRVVMALFMDKMFASAVNDKYSLGYCLKLTKHI
jgi:SAM-dependent methyltransferase